MRKLFAAVLIAIALMLASAPSTASACVPDDPGYGFCS